MTTLKNSKADVLSNKYQGTTIVTDLGTQFQTIYAAKLTTAGGSPVEGVGITGVLATDGVIVTVNSSGVAGIYLEKAEPAANSVDITFSTDPLAATEYTIFVYRIV